MKSFRTLNIVSTIISLFEEGVSLETMYNLYGKTAKAKRDIFIIYLNLL